MSTSLYRFNSGLDWRHTCRQWQCYTIIATILLIQLAMGFKETKNNKKTIGQAATSKLHILIALIANTKCVKINDLSTAWRLEVWYLMQVGIRMVDQMITRLVHKDALEEPLIKLGRFLWSSFVTAIQLTVHVCTIHLIHSYIYPCCFVVVVCSILSKFCRMHVYHHYYVAQKLSYIFLCFLHVLAQTRVIAKLVLWTQIIN